MTGIEGSFYTLLGTALIENGSTVVRPLAPRTTVGDKIRQAAVMKKSVFPRFHYHHLLGGI